MDRELENIIKDIDENKLEDLTSSKIKEYKNNILQKMGLEGSMVKKYHKILKDYKYIDERDERQERDERDGENESNESTKRDEKHMKRLKARRCV